MKLILTQEVNGLGLPGDVVEVRDGYGRNFLVPRGDAIVATKGAEKQISQIKRAQEVRQVRDVGHAQEIAATLKSLSVKLEVRTGEGGRLFGSVTPADVVSAVKAAGGPILDKRRVELPGHIKATGKHEVVIKIHDGVDAKVNLNVVAAE